MSMSLSSPHHSTSLPAEVVDRVAFHLRPELNEWETLGWTELMSARRGMGSLRSCSLVSRQWRVGTLPHLFHSIRYSFRRERDGDDVPPDQDFAKDPVRYKTLSMFSDFLLDSPAVSTWIKTLRLVYWPPHWTLDADPEDYPTVSSSDVLDPQPFSRLLRLCPRLEALHLEGVLLRDIDISSPVACRPLRCLKISLGRNFDFMFAGTATGLGNAVLAPLVFFSSVKRLCFSDLALHTRLNGVMIFPALEVDVLELEGCGEGIGAVVDALRRSPSAITIRSLHMNGLQHGAFMGGSSDSLDQLLETIGPKLEVVMCHGIRFKPRGWAIVPRLTSCTQLRSLRIGAQIKAHHTAWIIREVLRLLAIPAVAPLEQLGLRFEFRNVTSFANLLDGFRPLDSALVRLAETHGIHRIVVECDTDQRGPLEGVSDEALIRDLLPQLDAGGKLAVGAKSK